MKMGVYMVEMILTQHCDAMSPKSYLMSLQPCDNVVFLLKVTSKINITKMGVYMVEMMLTQHCEVMSPKTQHCEVMSPKSYFT